MRLTEEDVSALDELVAEGTFRTRSDVLRAALAALL
ncbi:MAG: ribbon-helix-helix protein, CopG family, partial [Actinobacteria bacterium]|nr:ribbon-helix-helix protein, CopG family [Actinomycetota bacterium]